MFTENQILKKDIITPRQDTLKLKPKGKLNLNTLETTFNNTHPAHAQIINNRWGILKLNAI